MFELVTDFIHTTEDRILKRVIRVVAAVVAGALMLLVAMGWVSIALYFHLTQWLLPWQAALAIGFGALVLGAVILAVGLMKKHRKRSQDDVIAALVGALTQPDRSRLDVTQNPKGHSASESALIATLVGLILYDKSAR